MKGKTKKRSPNPENGTPSKTSTAPVAGNLPLSTGKGSPPSNSATPPHYPSSISRGSPPPCYSMSKRPNSPTSGGAPPSLPSMSKILSSPTSGEAPLTSSPAMGKRSRSPTGGRAAPPCSTSMGKGPASQAYHESSGPTPDQNRYYTNDYSCSDQQSYLSDYVESHNSHKMDIAHTQSVESPPYSNSQDSNLTYGQSSSKYDHYHSIVQHDHNKCASKNSDSYTPPSGIDHQPFEYDTYSSRDYAFSSSSRGHHPSSAHDSGSPSYDHSGPSSPHGHSGPPSSHGYSGPSSPHDHSGPSSSQGHSDQPLSQVYGSSSYASQYSRDNYNSYPQCNEGQQSSNNCSNSTQGYSNGYQEPFPRQQQNNYVSSPEIPKGHYNPENVDETYQVSTPLKPVSKTIPVKKPPRSPKTPISLPPRAREIPSPSIAAKALTDSPIEDYKNIVQSLPSKPGPQIPYREMLPKSPKKEIFVTFPDGQMVKQFVDPNMAMMDLLIQLTASKRMNPSGYLLVALSEDGNRPVDYKANQPVGLVKSHRVKLISKERVKTQQMSQTGKATEKQLPFEGYDYEIYQPGPRLVSPNKMTYRLTVNLPHSQKVVRRMSANHPLYELHQSVCEEKNLDPNIFVFQLPDKPTSQVNLKYTLQELGLVNNELNLVHRAEMDHYKSVPNLSNTGSTWMSDQPTVKSSTNATYVHMPPPGDSRKKKGFFSFLRKDKRGKSRSLSPTSFSELADTLENWMSSFLSGDLLNSRNSGKSRPASMFAPMTDTFDSYLKKPKKSSKKKPAPPPPTGHPPATGRKPQDDYTGVPMQQQLSNYPPGEAVNSGTDQGYQTFQMHSRTSSDSSSYYEQRARADPVGTDSITYVEDSDGMNNFSKPSSTQHHYVSDIPQSVPFDEDDHPPESVGGKNVTPIFPPGLSVQLKTANDMYASPFKKRKPAPLPPPGGPQVRPKFDILSSASISAERYRPDTPNTCNLSVSNALDKPNSSNSASAEHMETTNHASRTSAEHMETTNHASRTSAEHMEITNHASRTPLITIKTGPFTIENESSTSLKEDVKDIGIENKEKDNDWRVEIMDQKQGCEEKLEFPDQDESTELIVEDLSLSIISKVDASVQIKGNALKVENPDQGEISCFGGENHIQKESSDLIVETAIQKESSDLIVETAIQKESSDLIVETAIQKESSDLIVETAIQKESSDLIVETAIQKESSDLIVETAIQKESSDLIVETAIQKESSDLIVETAIQKESSDLIVETAIQKESSDLIVETAIQKESSDLIVETAIQKESSDLIVETAIQRADKIIETPALKEKIPIKGEITAQTEADDLIVESLVQVEASDLSVETPAQIEVSVETPMETPVQIEVNNLEEETPVQVGVCLETPAKAAAQVGNLGYLEEETPAQVEIIDLIIEPPGGKKVTDAKIETPAKEVITDLTVENTVQENSDLKEEFPAEIEGSNLVVETTIQSVISDLKRGIPVKIVSTDLNIETPAEANITDLETLIQGGECTELNLDSSFQTKVTDIVVESVDPKKITGLKVETPSTQAEGSVFKIETLAQVESANLKIEHAAQEKITDFIVEKQAQEDTNLIVEIAAQDEGTDLENDAEKVMELIPLNDLVKYEVSANDFATFEKNHIGEVDIKLLRPCSFNAPPPPLTPPPAEPPTDIPSPVIIIGTEMVDKSVGISEDSTSLTASPHGGHARSLSKVSTTSSIGTAEEVTFAFDETIAVAEEALQNELMEQIKKAQTEDEEQQTGTTLFVEQMSQLSSEEALNVSPTTTNKQQAQSKQAANGSPEAKFQGTAAYLAQTRDSVVSAENEQLPDTITSDATLEGHSPRKKNSDLISISSDGSNTTIGVSDASTNSVHITEAEVCNVSKEATEAKQHGNDITEIQMPIPQKFSQSSVENEKIGNGKTSVIEMEHFQVNGIEIGIEKTAAITKTKIGQQVTVIRPNLETSASLELSRSSSAAELAQYMESPKEELLLTKQDRQGLDYRGSPLVEVQKKLEEELKKEEKKVPSREGSPKIMLKGISLSLDSEPEMHSSDIETGPQDNLKKQIERWQKQLQEHLSDNSGLYTPQEQDKLKQKVDQWNKQLKELNVMDTSGFRLLEQNVLKQQIELWQRKLLAKERQYDGRKKFQEQETEFLNKQIAVWKKKIEVIERSANLYTTKERDVLQQQIELWQSQLAKNDNMDTHEKEQNLLKRQIEIWKKNLKEKKFAGYTFSQQEQDILKQQLNVWQKQLQWYKTGGVSAKREILREQVDVWHLQLLDVQKNPSEDSKIEQEILEQQIELWQSKLTQKDNLSEDIMLKQIDIWKRQTDSNRKVDDKYLVREQMIIEKEIQLWNKRLSGEDDECEIFIALEQDLLHEKIELCQQKLKNNVEIDSPDMLLEQEMLKLQVDLWQQKVSAMQEKKLAMINYKEEEQDILKFQIRLWEDKLIKPSEKNSAVAISERGTELLAQEVDLWQRWLDVKKENKEARIKFKLLDEELQKEQIRLWQDHLNVIKNDTLGYTEEEREILMQQIELWQKGLTEKKDGKTIHLAAEQDILKKYIDLWYNKMRRNTASSISEERDDVRQQIEIWKKQLNMYTLDDNPLSHSARQDIINQQISIWQKKRERCSVDADELTRIESEILQQQIELWQKDLMEYEQGKGSADKEMPKEQIKLLKRTLSQRKTDIDPEILAQEKAIVNRQIDLYQKKLDNGHELDSRDFINDEQKILEQQIDLWHRKLCLPDEGKVFYSESEYDILQKQVSLWHQQLVAIQHRQECQQKLAIQEQNLLKEQIKLWEMKLEAFPDPVFMVEEQDAMKDQIELWQQQLEEHKSIILNKTASTPDDPELRKMELMLRSQEEIIQSFKEGLKNLPEHLKTRTSPPSVLPPPIPVKEIKPVRKVSLEFPPPPETFSDKENFTSVKLKQTMPKTPPKPPTPPPLTQVLANLKKVGPSERPTSPVKDDNEQDEVLRAVPAVVLKKPALARKPKRKLPEPVLTPREELMLEIKNFAGRSKLKGVKLKDTKWSGASYS